MRTASAVLFLLLSSLTGRTLSAQEPTQANPTRPSSTDNAFLTAYGYTELEIGWLLEKSGWNVPTLLKFTVLPRVELGFNMVGLFNHEDGQDVELGDPGFQVKGQVARGDWGALAVVARLDLPKNVSPRYVLYGVTSLPRRTFQLDATLGVTRFDRGDGRYDHALFYAAALSPKTSGRLGGYVELFGEASDGPDPVSVDGGLAYAVSPTFVLDTSLALGLSDAAPDWLFQVGFTATLFSVLPPRPGR